MNTKDLARLCKLVESAINLIVDGYKTSEEFLFLKGEMHENNPNKSTLVVNVQVSRSPHCINLTIAGETQEIIIQSGDGEDMWDSMNPLSDRVEEAVLKLVS